MELLFSDELEKWHAWESRALTQESLAALIPTLGACFMFAFCLLLARVGQFDWVREDLLLPIRGEHHCN